LAGGILLTIHRLSQGGADRVTMLLANGFAAAGIPTGIAILRDGGEGEGPLLDLLHEDVRLSSAGAPMGSRHLELVRGLRYIPRQIARAHPSIVLASSSNMGLVTGLCARMHAARRPHFAMKLTNPVIRPRDRGVIKEYYRRKLYRLIFGSYDRILILSDAESETLKQMFPRLKDRFVSAANPYVTSRMIPAPRRERGSDTRNILTLARMMPQKRLDRLLDSFARVTDTTSRLTILGDGPERVELARLAQSLGIADRVDMPGFVEDVVPWLRSADLFVLSSDYEGLPAVVLEALACDVPVITTDCFEAARSLLAGADGCAVVELGDIDAFAKAIDTSLSLRVRPTQLSEIAKPYGIMAAIAAHIALLQPLLRQRSPCGPD
jgi:glycosyltransferase involved in cell wall biosynthesis